MRNQWRRRTTLAVTLLLAAGCGDDGTSVPDAIITKASANNGDGQTGPATQLLPNVLRVAVTRAGAPASDITVTWATDDGGTLLPATQQTDANGLSSSAWTLGGTGGPQTATASISGGLNSTVTFTATATGGTQNSTIQVRSADAQGGNRFSPSTLMVTAGTTVTWEWTDQTFAHNVVPDDGSTPAPSGSLVSGPHTYQYTFTTPGTFHYHCQAHGGSGMVGTVTVTSTNN